MGLAVGLALLALAPLAFGGGFQLGLMSQMCAMALFALSYNLLLGQTGMLSFGHAVYAGLGGYAVIHLLRAVESGMLVFPVVLLPVAGAGGGGVRRADRVSDHAPWRNAVRDDFAGSGRVGPCRGGRAAGVVWRRGG